MLVSLDPLLIIAIQRILLVSMTLYHFAVLLYLECQKSEMGIAKLFYNKGDQIDLIFAYWASAYFGQLF
jgi:hypothetical protein